MQEIFSINWLLWLSTMVPLTLSAGPGNLMVATSGAQSGVRRSVRFIVGLDITYFLIAVLVGLGLYHTLTNNPTLVWALQVAGSFYILWLGVRMLRRPLKTPTDKAMHLQFRDGIVVQLGNVQGIVMLLVMFSTFMPSVETSSTVVLPQCGADFAELLLARHLGLDGLDRAETDPIPSQIADVSERCVRPDVDSGCCMDFPAHRPALRRLP